MVYTIGPYGSASQTANVRASVAHGVPQQQQSLEMALSGASSVPVMYDEAPGWGKDQGLSKSSLNPDRDQQQQGSARGSGSQQYNRAEAPARPVGQRTAAAAARSAGGFAWPRRFVLPSQRPTSAAAAAAGSGGQHGVQSGGGRDRRSGDGRKTEGAEFVTVNL
jgi:hypothetical protein